MDIMQHVNRSLSDQTNHNEQTYSEFEGELFDLLQKRFDVTQGDAQGMVEAHQQMVYNAFDEELTTNQIIAKIWGDENDLSDKVLEFFDEIIAVKEQVDLKGMSKENAYDYIMGAMVATESKGQDIIDQAFDSYQ